MKLILGTAEFQPKWGYGEGVKEPPTDEEINEILAVAYAGGISILEGAESYNCDWVFRTNPDFDLIYKVRHPYSLDRVLQNVGRARLMGLLYHHKLTTPRQIQLGFFDSRVDYYGSSIYTHEQADGPMIEVPLNLGDKTFEKDLTYPVKIVRSVFGRGKLLKDGRTVRECLEYVRNIPNVHGVIVGVNKASELEDILEVWNHPPKFL